MTPGEISSLVGIGTAVFGFVSGVAVGAWTISSKNHDLKAHGKAIESIVARCDRQKEIVLMDVKATICDAMKIALRDLKGEIREKQTATERDLAVVAERVLQAERDIDELFKRLREVEKQ